MDEFEFLYLTLQKLGLDIDNIKTSNIYSPQLY